MTTLIHITDTHLFGTPEGRLKGVDTLDTLYRVIAHAAAHHPDAAAWVLTGDLSQDETAASYTRLADALAGVSGRIFALPGNHDDPDAMRTGFRQGAATVRMDGSFFCGNWQVVLVNSRVAGRVEGRVSETELARLKGALAAHPRHHALVCVHHQPLPVGSAWLDAIGMENGPALLDATTPPNARALLWGHVHQEYDGTRNGLRTISTPATCIQFAASSADFKLENTAPGYRVLQIDNSGAVDTHVVRVGPVPVFTYEPGDPAYSPR